MIDSLNEELGVRKQIRNTSLIASLTWTAIAILSSLTVIGLVSKAYTTLLNPPLTAEERAELSREQAQNSEEQRNNQLRAWQVELASIDEGIAATASALEIKQKDMGKRIISRKGDREEFDRLNETLMAKKTRKAELQALLGSFGVVGVATAPESSH